MISGVAGPAAAGAAAQTAQSKAALGKEDFLKLLVTQLQNQDPLNPTDNTAFVAQLAQFSSLEGITNLNTSMEGVSASMKAVQNSNAASLIGKTVMAEGSDFTYSDSPVTVGYNLTGQAADVKVNIFDSTGRLIRTIGKGGEGSGMHEAAWDGKDMNGAPCASGTYSFAVNAKAPDNSAVSANTYVNGKVSGVSLDGTNAGLVIGNTVIGQNKLRGIY
jgi:flagellar basal-body rod modification protein FlgD